MLGVFMKILLIAFSLSLISCAHHRDVRPNDSGIHSVSFLTEDKTSGYQNGNSQANHFCEQRKKSAYIVKEGYKYTGTMDEETYKNTKTASKVASGVGSAAFVFGGKKESNAGVL